MGSEVQIAGVRFGEPYFTTVAGPCSVESEAMALTTALGVMAAGASVFRGGAFKPRSSPRSFQGLGFRGLEILREVKRHTGLPVVTECTDIRHVEPISEVADAVQIGARSMQNFALLTEVGRGERPVLLKRGFAATVDELLLAADYVRDAGNDQVILCERGIRTFESSYRFTLDLNAVAILKERADLPVIVDPSHAAGRRELVPALSRAAVAAGADGLLVEVHPCPEEALCDGRQALELRDFGPYLDEVQAIAHLLGRRCASDLQVSECDAA
jgi:3-deoxy-7-phosphoheptulonate synthase